MAFELVYETHSITEDNEAGIATGWLPGRLSKRGREVAAALGSRRPASGFDALYTSDLARAVETGELAYGSTSLPRHTDVRLRECCYGALDGHPVADVDAVRRHHIDEPFSGGGQSYREIVEATRVLLDEFRSRHDGQRILVIAHSANRWALLHLLDGMPLTSLIDDPPPWQPGWEWTVE